MSTMTFQEFLHRKAEEQHHPERRQRREEWVAAVGRLLDQIRAWLAESDPEGLLDILSLDLRRAEPDLGVYSAPGLRISMGDAAVEVVPVGRVVLGRVHTGDGHKQVQGRVDITDRSQTYILYRTLEDGQERWYVADERTQAETFDRARLEGILQDLLS